MKHRVAVVGSGNWGTAIARIVALNTAANTEVFESEVRMWVHEEMIGEEKLSAVINKTRENVKYLPGVKLPNNLVAEADMGETSAYMPNEQFIERICETMKGHVHPGAVGISCIKGVKVNADSCQLYPEVISGILGIPCGALSGANIASEVARDKFSEATIAYDENFGAGTLLSADVKRLFERDSFRVEMSTDVAGVCLGGALKNVVAVAAGFVDGLGSGDNAKAAVMRRGLLEMRRFGETFFQGRFEGETIMSGSCGIGDLIASCLGGRNRRCAEAFVRSGKEMAQLEMEMLNGQKLQGADTSSEVYAFLERRGRQHEFPLFVAVYRILYEAQDAGTVFCVD